MTAPNPMLCSDGKWRWWDETEDLCETPYATEAEAKHELEVYVHWLETGELPLTKPYDSCVG